MCLLIPRQAPMVSGDRAWSEYIERLFFESYTCEGWCGVPDLLGSTCSD